MAKKNTEDNNCPNCGMPLNNLHTRMSCKANQFQFELGMGMHDSTQEPETDKKDDDKDNTTQIVITVILIIIGIILLFQSHTQ